MAHGHIRPQSDDEQSNQETVALGGVLISGISVYTVVPSLTGISSCAYLPLLSGRRYALSRPCLNR